MDMYDTQTLGFMVFGGFMVISAIGIFLVSTFSMKETSYEEALAKQRREQEKAQQVKSEKKKKEKSVEKKGKPKKKEEKPNGRIVESEPVQEASEAEAEVEPVAIVAPTIEAQVAAVSSHPTPEISPSVQREKKKEKKVAKVEPALSQVSAHPLATGSSKSAAASTPAPMLEMVTKEVPVMAVPPVGAQQSATVATTPAAGTKKTDATTNQDEPKLDAPTKKKVAPKKKSEPPAIPADSLDGPLYIPYKSLVSTVSSMDFSEGEAQRLIEILMDKAGIVQDTWHTATQKGDPVAALKRQLEEKEKQFVAEQEDSSAAKNKLRELNKEFGAEKAKAAATEAKLKEQLSARGEELNAMQTRMQASYQDHITESQQLQSKIRTLQEQLENGPNAQIARLQQENSILRDALNQATSQTESKQNAELAKLRQECTKLTKELNEKSESLQQDEQQKKSLEAKVAKYEQQITQLQSNKQETESTLQKRLDDVSEELRKSQSSHTSLLASIEKTKGEQQATQSSLNDIQAKLASANADQKSKTEELDSLRTKLMEASSDKAQLEERIKSIETLLEADQSKETEKEVDQATQFAAIEDLENRLKEKDAQVFALERELLQLREISDQQKNKNNELREKNWKAMEALAAAETMRAEKLSTTEKAKEEAECQLNSVHIQTKEMLQLLFPGIPVPSQQLYSDWLQEFKEKALESLEEQKKSTDISDVALKLKEAEEAQSTLQAECDQYRIVLAETEGMLKDLQKSVEEEEHIWKGKIGESEAELRKAQSQVKTLEETVERLELESQNTEQMKEIVAQLEAQLKLQLESAHTECQKYSVELEELRDLLGETQNQLKMANSEVRKQSEELSLVRQHLCEMETHMHDGESVGLQAHHTEPEPGEFKTQLEESVNTRDSEQALRQKLAEEFEEAQRSVSQLQGELEKVQAAGDSASDREHIVQFQGEEKMAVEEDGLKEGTSV
ncbi:LOW QUALITY PROTEIN: ribosome-binding protein 1 [Callorhinchus milii]|uniref:LOW QUALITY PROTEIN: ribosome-binding protein 1 n=1 Tax=Callorhinchus milii TaxID=7868 RepID=UPI001C3FF19F|nr:LOW QUALITY PROTEIN: ribosome-binding protein 1 [Callorhinchus milii]